MNHTPSERIAVLAPSLAAGGVARSLLTLAGGFVARGHAVDLVLCQASGAFMDAIPAGVRQLTLRAEPSWRARARVAAIDWRGIGVAARPAMLAPQAAPVQPYLADLARYLARERPAALLAAKTHTNLLAIWARALASVSTRVVVSERTQLSQSIALSRKWRWRHVAPLVARHYPRADAITAVSDGVADDLARTTGVARASIQTLYNPVVTPEMLALASAPPAHPWLEQDIPVIVAAGRLVPQKNFPLLLHAFAAVRAQRPARLVILGEGRERPALEALARTLGVADAVALPGFVANPHACFARAAVCALSSDYEGLPGVLIQALACGAQVVATDCPSGPAEILAGGRYGALVPVGDAPALAAALLRAMDDPLAPGLLRERAAHFSLEHSVTRHLSVLVPDPVQARTGTAAHHPGSVRLAGS